MKLVQYGSGRVPRVDIREISCAVSVGGFRGKHSDFDLGEFDSFDQRWRQELLGEHFAGQWNVHTFGSKSAGCQGQWVGTVRVPIRIAALREAMG